MRHTHPRAQEWRGPQGPRQAHHQQRTGYTHQGIAEAHPGKTLPPIPPRGRLSPPIRYANVTVLTLFFLLMIVAALAAGVWTLMRGARHRRALTRLLDAADVFESRLRAARNEIETLTGEEDASVKTALQEMLRQRLWLQQHGAGASSRQLDELRVSMEAARQRIDQQLLLIERARTPTL